MQLLKKISTYGLKNPMLSTSENAECKLYYAYNVSAEMKVNWK